MERAFRAVSKVATSMVNHSSLVLSSQDGKDGLDFER